MNNRKWPRTLNEAFPGTPEYSCAIEQPYPSKLKAYLRAVLAIIGVAGITLIIRAAVAIAYNA